MADSPKCRECYLKGTDGQTYKVAGKQIFKCKTCGSMYPLDFFDPEEFAWKTNPEQWKTFMESLKIAS